MTSTARFFSLATEKITAELEQLFRGEYIAILIMGAAARKEISWAPDGKLLSDLDLLVVFPQRNLLYFFLKKWLFYYKHGDELEKLLRESSISINLGLGNASSRFWSLATPIMWELRMNARVLYGTEEVKDWPVIVKSHEIPQWEGIRLLLNRLCELLGNFGTLYSPIEIQGFALHYSCLKLALACSEAMLIDQHVYQATYKERYFSHGLVESLFGQLDNKLIQEAYQAKLGVSPQFFNYRIDVLIQNTVRLALSTLARFGISDKNNLKARAKTERPVYIGFGTDVLFFLQSLYRGRKVSFRYAILDTYTKTLELSKEILDSNNTLSPNKLFCQKCNELFYDFKITPQITSVVYRK